MTISRDDVLLADRFAEDDRNFKTQQSKVSRMKGAEREKYIKAYEEKVRGEQGKLARLASTRSQSADARARLEQEVDPEVRRAVEQAEIAQRASTGRIPEMKGILATYRQTLARLEENKAPLISIQSQRKAVAEVAKELAGLEANAKRAEEKVHAARKAFNAAIEAIRKDALAQE